MSAAIREARADDVGLILAMVRELADYERLLHEVEADEAGLRAALFSPAPRVFCDLAEHRGEPAGMALWYVTFSTFQGRHGIYLEDLFVRPAFRGEGVGAALLAHLAARCVAQGYGRLEWSVLDWNAPAIAFYKARGAQMLEEWTRARLSGAALRRLGGAA